MALCSGLAISGQWLLTGQGPMDSTEVRQEAIKEATPGELLASMGKMLDGLNNRVDRLETVVRELEDRVRG